MTSATPVIGSRPANPTPVADLIDALKRIAPLQGMEECEYEWLATYGVERYAEAGATLFHEGDAATSMTILLKGEIHVRRERGGPAALFIGRSGQITGLLPFSRMKTYGGLGYAAAPTWALEYDHSLFPEMVRAVPSITQRCVSVLLDRVREVTRMEQQTEKLNALGKLAGNLAHELNNPASAAQRAASGLLEELRVYGREKYRLGGLCLDQQLTQRMQQWQQRMRDLIDERAHATLTPLLEDDLQTWLRAHGVQETWQIAPELAESGITPAELEPLAEFMDGPGITVVLSQFASSLRAERIAKAMLDSTARIFDLMRAIKDYSYMDQAPIQEVDLPQSLENTLTMLQSRLEHVTIERHYAPDLPRISAYGSELNQVWMALLENALDAIEDRGTLTLSVKTSGDLMLIEIWDSGNGIPAELTDRIFEPFFTTKAPGRGLGLGLDTVQRIIRKHRGYVSVESRPGSTCFQVRLPIEQLQAY
ncbi:sensor histidine kinase [Acidipila rosea]|uniref:histidine kinase n=1 Tax=Acidipila rosea TaxID=768535 RepID=A0A4R1LAF3_9BACT|nr:ATP-binding protein [Acidipila rosea]TCK75272.1 histidine kinase/DNA gyrase B/HSP90-like ATPase [Acidipila rosea]